MWLTELCRDVVNRQLAISHAFHDQTLATGSAAGAVSRTGSIVPRCFMPWFGLRFWYRGCGAAFLVQRLLRRDYSAAKRALDERQRLLQTHSNHTTWRQAFLFLLPELVNVHPYTLHSMPRA